MKKLISLSICAAALLALATSCPKAGKPLSAADHLDLGEKYMVELDYEKAIPHFLEAIEVDPMNEQAYVPLAEAYIQSGEPERGQAVLEMGHALFHDDEEILENLLGTMVAGGDAQAVGRLAADAQRTGGQTSRDLENAMQGLAETGYVKLIEKIIEVLYEQDNDPLLALCLELWLISNRDYEVGSDRSEAVCALLFEKGKNVPQLGAGEEYYFGGYDEEGNRHGFGICIYGEGAGADNTIYIGYWDKGSRNGEGAVYYGAHFFVEGNWTGGLPNGAMTRGYKSDIDTYAITTEATYIGGALQGGATHSFDDGRMPAHDIWDEGVSYIRG